MSTHQASTLNYVPSIFIEVKTSLGALSKTLWVLNYHRLTRNARSGKVSSSHCYLNRRPLHEIDEIVYEYDKKQFQQLVYIVISRVIFNTLVNIIRVCRSRYVL